MNKKILTVVLTFIILCGITITASAYSLGDVDNSGKITAADARAALRFSSHLSEYNDEEKEAADINNDGSVTAADARIILRIAASLENIGNYTSEITSKKPTQETLTQKTPYEIYSLAIKYTVEIKVYAKTGKLLGLASGFFTNYDGTVVTNYHVIEDAYSMTVTDMDGKTYKVTSVLGYNVSKDIAILSTNAENEFCADLSVSDVKVGDNIYVLGSSIGLTGTFSDGIVSTSERVLDEMKNNVKYIQITAPISNGNSGGPVIDRFGQVIGIASMCYSSAQNLNFAIPVNEISTVSTKNPVSVEDFSNRSTEAPPSDIFSAVILSDREIKLSEGGTAIIYAFTLTSSDYTIECASDSSDITATVGKSYGNLTVIYVSAKSHNANGKISVYCKGAKENAATADVSTSSDTSAVYGGLSGNIPDFGAITEVAPSQYLDGTTNGDDYYMFCYKFSDINEKNLNSEECFKKYVTALEKSGFTYSDVTDDNTAVCYVNKTSNTKILFGYRNELGNSYMYVLIYY